MPEEQIPLEYEEFIAKLKELKLSKQDFAAKSGYSYTTVLNWKSKPIPVWVESWLELYEISLDYKEIVKSVEKHIKRSQFI
ncbi:MAG: hypothetical protein LBL65_05490 [Campylobacteraceae bacterium]|jgi:hypothetical protein|nr:hypothetical protein [Campylobacteraceae bacterium]